MHDVNWLAVLVAAIIPLVVGFSGTAPCSARGGWPSWRRPPRRSRRIHPLRRTAGASSSPSSPPSSSRNSSPTAPAARWSGSTWTLGDGRLRPQRRLPGRRLRAAQPGSSSSLGYNAVALVAKPSSSPSGADRRPSEAERRAARSVVDALTTRKSTLKHEGPQTFRVAHPARSGTGGVRLAAGSRASRMASWIDCSDRVCREPTTPNG